MSTDLTLAAGEKSQQLEAVTSLKQAIVNETAAPAVPDISEIDTIHEYRERVGTPDASVVYHFLNREERRRDANYRQGRAESAEREKHAYAMDHEKGIGGTLKNSGGYAVRMGNSMGKWLATTPKAIEGRSKLDTLDDKTRDLMSRERGGEDLKPEDLAYLEENATLEIQTRGMLKPSHKDLGISRRDQFDEAMGAFETAAAIEHAFEHSVNAKRGNDTLNRDDLTEDLHATYDKNVHHFSAADQAWDDGDYATMAAEGLTGLVKMAADAAGDLASHPGGTFEYIVEQLPQLAIGLGSTKLLAATNMAYSADIYQQGMNEFVEENGRAPTQEEDVLMVAAAVSAGLAEQVGDKMMLGAWTKSLANKAVTDSIQKVVLGAVVRGADKTAETIAKVGLTAAKAAPVGRVAIAATKSAVTEAGTEVYQTYVEEGLAHLETDVDGFALFQGGVIGAAAGAGLSGAGAAGREAVAPLKKRAELAMKKRANQALITQRAQEAVQSGDVNQLLDPEDPELRATGQAALVLDFRLGDPEKFELDEEGIKATKEKIKGILLAQEERVADIEAAYTQETDVDKKEALKLQLVEEKLVLENVQDAADGTIREGVQAAAQIEATADVILSEEASPERDQAIEQVVSAAVRTPGAVEADIVAMLLEGDAITEEQRTILRNFSEAHIARNEVQTFSDVEGNILNGRTGFKGFSSYLSTMARAVRNGDTALANDQIAELTEFYKQHKAKKEALASAREQAVAAGRTHYVQKTDDGWVIHSKDPWKNKKERNANGGMFVNPNPKAIVAADTLRDMIDTELEGILATGRQLRAMAEGAQITDAGSAEIAPDFDPTKTSEPAPAPEGTGSEPKPSAAPEAKKTEEGQSPLRQLAARNKGKQVQITWGKGQSFTARVTGEVEVEQEATQGNTVTRYLAMQFITNKGKLVTANHWHEVEGLEGLPETPTNTYSQEVEVKEEAAKPEPKPEPKPKVDSKPTPEPKQEEPAPKPEPKQEPTPKPEPKVEPKPEPTPVPTPDPQPKPETEKEKDARLQFALLDAKNTLEGAKAILASIVIAIKKVRVPNAKRGEGANTEMELLQAMAALGGLNRDALENKGDYDLGQLRIRRGQVVFRANGGLDAGAMTEALFELGFLQGTAQDESILMEMIAESMSGNPQYSVQSNSGAELLALQEEQARAEQDVAEAQEAVAEARAALFPGAKPTQPTDAVEAEGDADATPSVAEAKPEDTEPAGPEAEVFDDDAPTKPELSKALDDEINDVAAMLNILGMQGTGDVNHVPTHDDVTNTLDLMLAFVQGQVTKAEVMLSLGWINTAERKPSDERVKRAKSRILQGKVKGPTAIQNHLNGQLIEELTEVLTELDSDPEVRAKQKAALKVLRFGAKTKIKFNKDSKEEQPNVGKTNAEVYNELTGNEVKGPKDVWKIVAKLQRQVADKRAGSGLSNTVLGEKFKVAPRDGKTNLNPLTAMANFLSDAFSSENKLLEGALDGFLGKDLEIEQVQLLQYFAKVAKHWDVRIQKNLLDDPIATTREEQKRYKAELEAQKKDPSVKVRPPRYAKKSRNDYDRREDLIQQLREGLDGVISDAIPENVRTAIAVAGFSYILENAGKKYNYKKDIAKILNLQNDSDVTKEQEDALRDAGVRQNLIIETLGKKVLQALQWQPQPGMTPDVQVKLELSLGMQVLAVLEQDGQMEIHNVPGDVFPNQETLGTEGTEDAYEVNHPFVRFHRDLESEDVELTDDIAAGIVRMAEGTGGIMSLLFSMDDPRVAPPTKEVDEEWVPAAIKKIKEVVPVPLQKIARLVRNRKHYLKAGTKAARKALSRDSMLEILGREDVDPATTLDVNLKSYQAKNDALERSIDQLDEFEANQTKKFFFFTPSIWNQFRVGLAENLINPQTDKYHRHNIAMQAWDTTIDANYPGSEEMRLFRLAIAQGMGLKVDKQYAQRSLEQLDGKNGIMNTAEMKAVIEILQNLPEDGELSEEDQALVVAAVKQGGEKMWSLEALTEWANYQKAKNDPNGSEFRTSVFFEVDGVTNGPALAHVQLGVVGQFGSAFGMPPVYFNNGPQGKVKSPDNFADHKEKGGLDFYETVTTGIVDYLSRVNESPQLEAIEYFVGELTKDGKISKDGRNLVKGPLTELVYGSTAVNTIDGMSRNFVANIYAKLQKAIREDDWQSAQITLYHFNMLLPEHMRLVIPESEDWDSVREFRIEKMAPEPINGKKQRSQMSYINSAFEQTVGTAVTQTLKIQFEKFDNVRKEMNKGAQMLVARYIAAYDYLYDLKLQAATYVERDGAGNALNDLNKKDLKAINDELGHLYPTIHTAFSKMDKENGLKAGLNPAKWASKRVLKKRRRPEGEEATRVEETLERFWGPYHQEAKFGAKVNGNKSMTARGSRKVITDPGVRALVLLIQSTDSFIASMSYGKIPALNVHDALGLGIRHIFSGAKRLNQMTYMSMANYSIPLEISEAVDRSFEAEAKLVQKYPGLKEVLADVTVNDSGVQKRVTRGAADRLAYVAYQATKNKYQFLHNRKVIDQYALEGGSYEVTDADRKDLKRKAEQLEKNRFKRLGPHEQPAPDKIAPHHFHPNWSSLNGYDGTPKAEQTPWGPTGGSSTRHNTVLVNALESGNIKTVGQLVRVLSAQLKAEHEKSNPAFYEFQKQILKRAYAIVDLDTPVRYIQPDTEFKENLKDMSVKVNMQAWVTTLRMEDGRIGLRYLGIKSPDFQASDITTETLTHEIVHVATQTEINRLLKADPATLDAADKDRLKAVQELGELRELAAAYVAKHHPDNTRWAYAASDIHELVAHGMTDKDFATQVLAQIKDMDSDINERGERSGMAKFLDMISTILFRKPSELQRNGLGILVGNTSLIMDRSGEAVVEEAADYFTNEISAMEASPDPMNFTSLQTYEALGRQKGQRQLSRDQDKMLHHVLSRVVDAAYGAFEARKAAVERLTPVLPEDVYLKALKTGENPYASRVGQALAMTDQERYVLEMAERAINGALDTSPLLRKELDRFYAQAQREVKDEDFFDGDWATATQDQRKEAERKRVLIMTPRAGTADGRSRFLSEFMAAALVYKPLSDKLATLTSDIDTRRYKDAANLAEAITMFFGRVMDWISRRKSNTHQGQNMLVAANAMVEQLVQIDVRNKTRLARKQADTGGQLTKFTESIQDKVRSNVKSVAETKFIAASSLGIVRGVGKATILVAGGHGEKLVDAIMDIRNNLTNKRQGVAASLVTEVRGVTDVNAWAHQLLADASELERQRKLVMDRTTKMVRNAFSRELNQDELEALTRVAMRSDLGALVNAGWDMAQIEEVLSDEKKLDKAIEALEKKLSGDNRLYYLEGAKALGYFLVTSKATVTNLQLNVHNIAFLANTDKVGTVSESEGRQAMKTLDPLTTLYALRYHGVDDKTRISELMRQESHRDSTANGVKLVIDLHRQLAKASKAELFDGNDTLMQKGYVKEIFDPHIELKAATAVEGRELEAAGYTRVSEQLVKDDAEPPGSEKTYLYLLRDRGLPETITGFFSSTGMHHQGFGVHGGSTHSVSNEPMKKNQRINRHVANHKRAAIQRSFTRHENWDPRMESKTFLVPVMNEHGKASNYRYMMQESTKELLNRDNRADEVMGRIAGSLLDKAVSPTLNRDAIQAMHNDYTNNRHLTPKKYIKFGPNSVDPDIRERYKRMPDTAKRAIREIWGTSDMYISNEVYDIAFGYRKYSVAEIFDAQYLDNRAIQALVFALEHLPYWNLKVGAETEYGYLGRKAALKLVQSERMWQEIVKVVKDIWVVKNLFTFLGNEFSNLTVALLHGVPLHQYFADKAVAYRAVIDYQSKERERYELKMLVDSGHIVGDEQLAASMRIVELDDALARNPVKDLVDHGMYQTLVEDIGQENDQYSYKSRLVRVVDRYTLADSKNSLVKGARTLGKNMLMTHDSGLYKAMNFVTVTSDFTSRYALYQHLTTKKDPMDQEMAIRRVRDAFVNYDIPTHKSVQYLNDMGLIWFTKYYLRIQMVLVELVRENPIKALQIMAMADWLFNLPDVIDSSFLADMKLNFGSGPLELVDAIEEIITLKAVGL